MCMSTLTRRTQILLDEDRYRRLSEEADARNTSVAALIREAIDLALPTTSSNRERAASEFLRLAREEPDPGLSPSDLKREILSLNERSAFGSDR